MPLEPKVRNGIVWNGREFQAFKILDASLFWVVFTVHPRRASAYQGTSLDFFSYKLMLFASCFNTTKPSSVSGGVSGAQCNPSAPVSQEFWAPSRSCESLVLSSAKNNLKYSPVAKVFHIHIHAPCRHSHGSSFALQGK